MKKLFVSVPMKGRTEEAIKQSIKKMHKIAELYADEELELIDSYVKHTPPENSRQAIWYLGESIKKLAEADVFITIDEVFNWNGCSLENEIAARYGIERYYVPVGSVMK